MIYHSLSLLTMMTVYQCFSNIIFSHQIAIFGCFRASSISSHSQTRPENNDGSDRWAGRRLISGVTPCPKWSSQGRAFKWFQANTPTWKLHLNGRNPIVSYSTSPQRKVHPRIRWHDRNWCTSRALDDSVHRVQPASHPASLDSAATTSLRRWFLETKLTGDLSG